MKVKLAQIASNLFALIAAPLAAQDCLSGNPDRILLTEFVKDFGSLTPTIKKHICQLPMGKLPDGFWPILEEMNYSNDLFWVDWKDDIRSILDVDYHYPYLQEFLTNRGLQPLSNEEREAILDSSVPRWREDYYGVEGSLLYDGYDELQKAIHLRNAELMVLFTSSDGWGFLIGPPGSEQKWHDQTIGEVVSIASTHELQ